MNRIAISRHRLEELLGTTNLRFLILCYLCFFIVGLGFYYNIQFLCTISFFRI